MIERRRVMGVGENPFIIKFKDEKTKRCCVDSFGGIDGGSLSVNYRKNGIKVQGYEGELTYEQADSIIRLDSNWRLYMDGPGYFDELQYFTGLTSIGDELRSTTVQSIVIPHTATWIDPYAFNSCGRLEKVTLHDNITSIGEYAFSRTGLTSIVLPSGLTTIGIFAFQRAKYLESASLPEGITELPLGLFEECVNLEHVNIPSTVEFIGQECFYNCQKLTSIVLPSDLGEIGDQAFYNCSSLASIKVLATSPPSVTNSTFEGIPNTTKIQVPAESVELYKWEWVDYEDRIIAIQEE